MEESKIKKRYSIRRILKIYGLSADVWIFEKKNCLQNVVVFGPVPYTCPLLQKYYEKIDVNEGTKFILCWRKKKNVFLWNSWYEEPISLL
jgi:hypothetical protein